MAQANDGQSKEGQSALAVALVRGKVTAIRKHNGKLGGYMHVLMMPAADEYSMPAGIEIHAERPLVQEQGQPWAGKVRIGGIPKSFIAEREGSDGEMRKVRVHTADNLLYAVE